MAARRRRPFRVAFRVLVPVALLLLAACTENYPRSTLAPASDFARMIDDLFETVLGWGLVVFVLVEGVLVFAILRFRSRGERDAEPRQVHGHTRLEIAWTIAPALILAFIAVPTIRTIFVTQADAPVADALQVRVVGHQWWWEFEYPDLGVRTANELHVPAARTVSFDLESADVIHSFWVPRLAGKRDVIAPHTNHLWFTPDSVGTYLGQCAEFCGHSHALMGFRVVVDSPEEFEAWVANQRQPAVGAPPAPAAAPAEGQAAVPDTSSEERVQEAQEPPGEVDQTQVPPVGPADAATGATDAAQPLRDEPPAAPQAAGVAGGNPARGAVLAQGVCAACHTIAGTNARGRIGPDLTHVASRARIAAELLPNTPEAMASWLKDPPALKPGAKMPNLNLQDAQIADLVAYLRTLK